MLSQMTEIMDHQKWRFGPYLPLVQAIFDSYLSYAIFDENRKKKLDGMLATILLLGTQTCNKSEKLP